MLTRILCILAVLPVQLAFATSLTITNQNIALVRDALTLSLKPGNNEIVHSPAATDIVTNSILLLPETPDAFEILEQGFEINTPDRDALLRNFTGQELKFLVKEQEKPDRIDTAKILVANGDNSLVEIDGTIRFGLPGQPLFPPLPESTRLRPAIVWTLSSPKSVTTNASVTYLASGLDWSADYNLVAGTDGETVDFNAMVAITNTTSDTFENCGIKLMAGDVSVSAPRPQLRGSNRVMAMAAMESAAPEVARQSFADMQLYTLPRPVTLPPGGMKQVEFASAAGVKARRIYIYDPQADLVPRHFGGDSLQRLTDEQFGATAGTRIDVFREIPNTVENGLGIPLPAGTMRFYESTTSGVEFTGERNIGHTAAGDTLRLATGAAFNLAGKRIRRDLRVDTANKTTTEQIKITLRNSKDSAVTIQAVERLARGANWQILKSSMKFERLDGNRIQFDVPVAASGEASVDYTVRYSW